MTQEQVIIALIGIIVGLVIGMALSRPTINS